MKTGVVILFNFKDMSLILGEEVIDDLGKPQFVQFQINEKSGMFMVRACEAEEEQAVVVPEVKNQGYEFGARSLIKRVKKIIGRNKEVVRACMGAVQPNRALAIFDVKHPVDLDSGIHKKEY